MAPTWPPEDPSRLLRTWTALPAFPRQLCCWLGPAGGLLLVSLCKGLRHLSIEQTQLAQARRRGLRRGCQTAAASPNAACSCESASRRTQQSRPPLSSRIANASVSVCILVCKGYKTQHGPHQTQHVQMWCACLNDLCRPLQRSPARPRCTPAGPISARSR